MPKELLPSLIALAGVAVSIIASVLVSVRQSKIEIKKLKTDLQMAYANKLVDKRMEAYPILFKLMSNFEKAIRSGTVDTTTVNTLLDNISDWNSSYSLFTSSYTIRRYIYFRSSIEWLKQNPDVDPPRQNSDAEIKSQLLDKELRKEMIGYMRELETALKHDLGVFVVDFPYADKDASTYSEVSELYHKQKHQG